MTAEIPKPAEIRKTKGYLWRRIGSKWPFLVWLGIALLAFKINQSGVKFERMNGIIVADVETISALEDGAIVLEMSVSEKGDEVGEKEWVVRFDKTIAIAERDKIIEKIKLDRIKRALEASTLKVGLETQIAELEINEETETEELTFLKDELPKLAIQLEKRAIENRVYQAAVQKAKLLEFKIKSYPKLINSLKASLQTIEDEIVKLDKFDDAKIEDHVLVKFANQRIERLERKSSHGGKISQIYAYPNSVVNQGDPIVDIIHSKMVRAKGFILEKDAASVSVGTTVYISVVDSDDDKFFEGEISFVSPDITSVLDVGSSVSGRTIKGREITCTFKEKDVNLIHGTSVTISLSKPGKFSLFSKD